MSLNFDRRKFIKSTSKSAVGIGLMGTCSTSLFGRVAPSDNIVVAVIGTNSRGSALARTFVRTPGVDVAYICDVDDDALAKGIKVVSDAGQDRKVVGIKDFRKILDDKSVDAVVTAMPDHWHAPSAIMALQAGKHVYVEKPGSHNAFEGELVVEAQRKYGRVVQVGTQRRSFVHVIEAINVLKSGIIGNPYFARTWYANKRPPIGFGKYAPVPSNLDYDLWQGPAPRRPYKDNLIHYNWHWFWHWGTGELLNNGTHRIDLARWGLGVDYPIKVSSQGGRYAYRDDWETPDTQIAVFDFPEGKTISWEGRSCNFRTIEGPGALVSFHSEQGTMVLSDNGYIVYDNNNKEIKNFKRGGEITTVDLTGAGINNDIAHTHNFAEAIRRSIIPSADYQEVNKSALLCHLGNIAYRVGKTIKSNPWNGRIIDDPEAVKLWRRNYEPGWEPNVL
jgi:predicted dehydrogenase